MKVREALALISVTGLSIVGGSGIDTALADKGPSLKVHLIGYQEVPAISTTGNGVFRAKIDEDKQTIEYTLSYSDLEGDVTQAHIHFGQFSVAGGVATFLCTNLGNGPAGTQPCPASPATITGTIHPADIIGPVPQGITAGQFDELVAAIRAGIAYANVHSTKWPGGEIRAQLPGSHGHHHHDED